ncbi:hypothetical protein Tco_1430136 [Tanacetum coccineum]
MFVCREGNVFVLRFEFPSNGGEESEIVRKKVKSGYVVRNVLMGCGGAYVGNEGNKKYNKEGLCEEEFRLEEGFEDEKYEGDDV